VRASAATAQLRMPDPILAAPASGWITAQMLAEDG
jgi:hypothetical protein